MSATERALRIAPLTRLDEFQRCVDLQLAVWQYDAADLIPRRMFLLANKIGGRYSAHSMMKQVEQSLHSQ